jgi:Flp pilus assembly pilin Flp
MAHLKSPLKNEEGQAVTEYILLTSILVAAVVALMTALNQYQVGPKLITFFTGDFAHSYQYGNPLSKGYSDGGPTHHPRAVTTDASLDNFRIFLVDQANRNEQGGQ